jgi:putative transposase
MRNPNHAQATYFARAAGTARFAYNWALRKWQRQYEAWKADNSQPALRNLPCAGS